VAGSRTINPSSDQADIMARHVFRVVFLVENSLALWAPAMCIMDGIKIDWAERQWGRISDKHSGNFQQGRNTLQIRPVRNSPRPGLKFVSTCYSVSPCQQILRYCISRERHLDTDTCGKVRGRAGS
jgi:hypothetical protein